MDNKTTNKKTFKVDNGTYETPFKFVLLRNNMPIKEHYFDCFGYIPSSIKSIEFLDVMREIVCTIKRDLEAKSRVYLWYTTPEPVKLTGFKNPAEAEYLNINNNAPLKVEDTDSENTEDVKDDEEITLTFELHIRNKVVFSEQWDGSVYPRGVRNRIDLTNTDAFYREIPEDKRNFTAQLRKHMNEGQPNLLYNAVDKIRNVIARDANGNILEYTYEMDYGKNKKGDNVTYQNVFANSRFAKQWEKAVRNKTYKYFNAYNQLFREEGVR